MLTTKEALERAIKVAGEAQAEWDAAPSGMRAGKILIALAGYAHGYRSDIDEIHDALAEARRGHCKEGDRCVCGGDTPAIQAQCQNWVKP